MRQITDKEIARINELYHKQKKGTLTPAEKSEQEILRKDYIAAIRASLRGELESVKIQQPDGTMVDVKERHDEKDPGGIH